MPELPEVETIRRGLAKYIVGKKVSRVEVREGKSFLGDVREVEGGRISSIGRRGKALLAELEGGQALMVHLRMTGQLIYTIARRGSVDPPVKPEDDRKGEERIGGGHPTEDFINELPSRRTRVVFEFEDGSKLFFNDQRKFGFIKVLKEGEDDGFLRKLGPEPWDEGLDGGGFYERLQRHPGMVIKAALLDQSVIAGVGNIYADEALFYAKVHPTRRVSSISSEEARRILAGVRESMEKAIESGGSSLQNYVRADGRRGDYLDKFAKVFRREGKGCPRCGEEIIKIRVAGRGTHVCPRCQKDQE